MSEQLGVLLLPSRLEEFEHEPHARALLNIPRVIALEPSRRHPPRFMRDSLSVRQAKRLRFPGEPRLLVLYHPAQYPLARVLIGVYSGAELWYIRPDPATLGEDRLYSPEELLELDQLARDRASQSKLVSEGADLVVVDEELRLRLQELEIISSRVFVPGARVHGR